MLNIIKPKGLHYMSFSTDRGLTKAPHKPTVYIDDQLKDFVQCADPKTGALYFLKNFFYIQHPTKGKLQYTPYDFQEELINTYVNNRFSVNLLSRQTGKCLLYTTRITSINNYNDASNRESNQIQIGELLWENLTLKEKIVTKLESWLVKLAK